MQIRFNTYPTKPPANGVACVRRLARAIIMVLLFATSSYSAENVRAWGLSEYGQLGNAVNWAWSFNPNPGMAINATGVKAIAGGAGFSFALKNDGTVLGWGNINGSNVPVPIRLFLPNPSKR